MLFATNDRTLGTCFVGKDCQAYLPIYGTCGRTYTNTDFTLKKIPTPAYSLVLHFSNVKNTLSTNSIILTTDTPGSPFLWVFRAILPVLFFRLRKTIISFRILMLTTKTSFPDP